MKKAIENLVVGLLTVILVAQVLSILPIGVKAQGEEFQASYSTGVPVIDGMLGQEWNDANSYAINLSGISWITPGPWDPAWVLATVYFKHDGTNIYLGLKVFASDHDADEFAVYFDEGNDGSYGSGTRDGVLTNNQEDVKSCWSGIPGVTIEDGCYKNGTWYGYFGGDFDAACVFVDGHWECEFSIPFVGNDTGGADDASDLVCGITDTVGIKIQYFTQPGALNYFYPADWQDQIGTYTTLSFASAQPPISPGITVINTVVGEIPPDPWNYLITDNEGTVLADFTLPTDGGTTAFSGAPFVSGGVFTLTATPKYGYGTDISAQTDEDSSAEIEGLQAIVTLAPNGAAWVTFTNAEEAFATAPLGVPPPGKMTYSVPPFKVVPVQAAWNPDKNNDQTIDLVAGKPTAVLVNLAGVSSGVTLRLAFAGAAPLPSPVDKVVTAADLAANSIVSFYPILLDTTSARDVTISVSYIAGTGPNIEPTTVTVRKTNDLSLYYGYLSKSAPTQANYNAEVTNSIAFMNMTYPVKSVTATTAYTKVTSQSSMLKDCMAIANKALANNRAVGVAVVSSTYFPNYGKPDAVGVSYGPNFKGVIVAENYWTAASHEVGHTFNLYWEIPEEYYSYPLYGQSASGVSAASGQWRAGQDFMGCAPYKTLDNTWVNSGITYNSLFNSLTQTLNDPEIVIVSGIFHKDDTLELPLAWSHLEQGTPSQIVPGDYALKFVDAGGNQIGDQTSFDAQFYGSVSMGVTVGKNRPTTEGGRIETDEAGFIFATVLPEGTSEIQILDKTTNPDGDLKGTVKASEIVDIGVSTDGYFTDSDYNPINSFECVFTTSTGSSYKMSATNPGTFCYNLKITNNDPTGTFTATVKIPSDFVLKPLSPGANPVQINGQPVTYSSALDGTLTVPNILISQGQTKTLTVHLDYGLKFKYGTPQPYTSNSQTTFNKGYAFRATVNSSQADTATIAAVGKKVTAIGGFLTDVNDVPKGGLTVEATRVGWVGTSVASSDGFYFILVAAGTYTYTVRITNSLTTPVGPVTAVNIAKDQFVEKDFNTLSPADPAITGFVTDTNGNGVSGVTVQLLNRQGKASATTTTNLGGYYVFRFSQPGQYTVKITVPSGYTATVTSTTLNVKQFETAKVNFNLAAKP